MEIPKVLADEEFRALKISKCQNPTVIDFWTKEAEKAGGEAALANMVPYITSKLTPFISNDMMRPIISQQKSSFDFADAMNNNKIIFKFKSNPESTFYSWYCGGVQKLDEDTVLFSHLLTGTYLYSIKQKKIIDYLGMGLYPVILKKLFDSRSEIKKKMEEQTMKLLNKTFKLAILLVAGILVYI
jgi:hypothetical protein